MSKQPKLPASGVGAGGGHRPWCMMLTTHPTVARYCNCGALLGPK